MPLQTKKARLFEMNLGYSMEDGKETLCPKHSKIGFFLINCGKSVCAVLGLGEYPLHWLR